MKTTKCVLAILMVLSLALGVLSIGASAYSVPGSGLSFPTMEDAMEFWRVSYLLATKSAICFEGDGEVYEQMLEDYWQPSDYKPGSSFELLAMDLIEHMLSVFGNSNSDLDYTAMYTAWQNGELYNWAQAYVGQLNLIYAQHLNQDGLSYLYNVVKPKQMEYTDTAYICECVQTYYPDIFDPYYDDWYNLWYGGPQWEEFVETVPFSLDSILAYYKARYDFYVELAAENGKVMPPVPTYDPTEPPICLSSGGVTLTEPYYGVFPPGSSLEVVLEGDVDTSIELGINNLAAYNIELKVNGVSYYGQLPAPVLVRLPLPPGVNGSNSGNLKVYHLVGGEYIEMDIVNNFLIDGYIEFYTDSFSPFVIALQAGSNTGGAAGTLKWWEKLPSFWRWILKIFLFGWIWMK
jgi:hypothetical protein